MVKAALKSPSVPLFQRGKFRIRTLTLPSINSEQALEKRGRGDFWESRA
jgi:hypothetical protein